MFQKESRMEEPATGESTRISSAVTAMTHSPGGNYGAITEILDEVGDTTEGLLMPSGSPGRPSVSGQRRAG